MPLVELHLNFIEIEWVMTSLWHCLSFLQTIANISISIEPKNFIFGSSIQQHKVHLIVRVQGILSDAARRSQMKVKMNKWYHLVKTDIITTMIPMVPRYNTISNSYWHKLNFLILKWGKVTHQDQDMEVSAFSECFLLDNKPVWKEYLR